MTRPFRFLAGGIQTPMAAREVEAMARRAEALGYAGLAIPDHLLNIASPLPVLAVAAAATDRLRLVTYVLNNDLRHPVVLAHELATLDVLSEGRLTIGIGAGWNRPEYDAMHLPFEPGSVRVARLAEALAVLKHYFSGERFDHEGHFYAVTGLEGRPRVVQRPHPPLLIGGGARRLLELAAREAQEIGLAAAGGTWLNCTADGTDLKLAWIRDAAGQRFQSIEIGTYPNLEGALEVTPFARARAERLAAELNAEYGGELRAQDVLESPHIFLGSADELVEKLEVMRERWSISTVTVMDMDAFAPVVERLAGR